MRYKKVYGLIGWPVKHSLSPLMHNSAFRYLKMDACYKLFPLKEDELEDFLRNLSKNNIFGLNVTIPYKEKVIKYLDWKSASVRFTGAANTIVVGEENYLKGFNTDGLGFMRHLVYDLKFKLQGKNVFILGAGGAAKAITYQLIRGKVRSIALYDIDREKAKDLKERLNQQDKACVIRVVSSLEEVDFKNIDLLINATPCGMRKTDPCPVKKDMLHKDMFVYDLIYNPIQTKLLKLAQGLGARTSNGLGMLLYQGVLSFKHFTGKYAPLHIMERALKEAVERLC
ncbi:MAG: shikimate dehydrogenase [Candidatus Omnitrophica bacterium]|nr:shikimate dehydrogenase [Candidatus Omnitrophota bacterium]